MFTIKDMLNIDELQDLTLVTDNQGIDNIITHVITMDNPEMVRWMKNGELLLTTGYNFIENDSMQKQLVMELANTGCSGLGIKIKRYFKKAPKIIVEEAQKVGLPIIEIPYYYTLSDMARVINEQIFSERMDTYKKQELFLNMIMQTVSKGGRVKGILSIAESILGCPVFITDTSFNIKEYSPACVKYIKDINAIDKSYLCSILNNMQGQKLMDGCIFRKEFNAGEERNELEVYSINIANIPIEYLILVKNVNNTNLKHTLKLVNILTTYLGNYYLIKYEHKFEGIKGVESFLFMLLKNSTNTLKDIENQAIKFGIDIEKKYVCTIIQFSYEIKDNKKHVQNMQYIIDNIKNILCDMGKRTYYLLTVDKNIIVIFEINDNDKIYEINSEMLELYNYIDKEFLKSENIEYFIANGNMCDDLSLIWKSYEEAIATIEIMKNNIDGLNAKIGHYTDYIIHHMLLSYNEGRKIYFDSIKPLVDHDKVSGDELTITLKEYINCQCKSTKAADRLYIHRNTLDYRLKKIKDILGYDFENYNKLLELQIALIALEL